MEYRDHNREKLRIEAEKARRTQWDIVNAETKQSLELPQPIKVGKATTTDLHLEKKLRSCFGDFDDVRRYVVSNKDEVYANHAHIVGVTSYPATSTSSGGSAKEEPTKSVKAAREKLKLESSNKSNWLRDDLHLSDDDEGGKSPGQQHSANRPCLNNAPVSSHSTVTHVKTEHGSISKNSAAAAAAHHSPSSSSTKNKNRAHLSSSQTHSLSSNDKHKLEKHSRPSASTGQKTPSSSSGTFAMAVSTYGNQALSNTGNTANHHHHSHNSKTQSSSTEKNRAWDLNRFLNTLPPSELSLSNNNNSNDSSNNNSHSKVCNSANDFIITSVEKLSSKNADNYSSSSVAASDMNTVEKIKKQSPERSKSAENSKIGAEIGLATKNHASKPEKVDIIKINKDQQNPIASESTGTNASCKEKTEAVSCIVADIINDKSAIKLSISKNKDGVKIVKKNGGRTTAPILGPSSAGMSTSSSKTAHCKDITSACDHSRGKPVADKSMSSSTNSRSKPEHSINEINKTVTNRVRKKSDMNISLSKAKSRNICKSDAQTPVGSCAGTIASYICPKMVVKCEPIVSMPSSVASFSAESMIVGKRSENDDNNCESMVTTTNFVDTLSPGKENYSVTAPNSERNSNHNSGTPSRNESLGLAPLVVHKNPLSSAKHAEAIVEKSRLSPLLSPIHEFPKFPSFEYKNGVPSLLCRLPLWLIKRKPPPLTVSSSTNLIAASANSADVGGTDAVSDSWISHVSAFVPIVCDSSDLENHNRKMPVAPFVEQNRGSDLYSSSVKHAEISLLSSSSKDLDDVPISERRKGKKASSDEKTNLDLSDAATSPLVDAMTNCVDVKPTIGRLPAVVQTSVENTINAVASSVALKKNTASLKSATKRKAAAAEPDDNTTPRKVAKSDCSSIMALAPDKAVSIDLKRDHVIYMQKAKEIKHEADAQKSDKLMRILLYLESVCYFFLTGYYMDKSYPKESQSPYHMIKDTHDLFVTCVQMKVPQLNELNERMQALFAGKIDVLSMRLQALLCFYMYWLKHSCVMANFKHIDVIKQKDKSRPSSVHGLQRPGSSQESVACSSRSVEEKSVTGLGSSSSSSVNKNEKETALRHSAMLPNGSSTPSPTPSPASSTGSSSHSLPPGLVAIPQQLDAIYTQQISYTHNLVNSVNIWQVAETRQKQHDYAFFNHLDTICRPLTLTSTAPPSCVYILTAVRWLRMLYDRHRTR